MPKTGSDLMGRAQHRRSEAVSHHRKPQHNSMIRSRKVDAADVSFSGNLLKEYKRQTVRNKLKEGVPQSQDGLKRFYQKVEESEAEFLSSCQVEDYSKADDGTIRMTQW